MGERYVKPDENIKILYADANNFYGHSMSEPSGYDEIKFHKNVKLEDISNTPDDSDFRFFVGVDLTHRNKIFSIRS